MVIKKTLLHLELWCLNFRFGLLYNVISLLNYKMKYIDCKALLLSLGLMLVATMSFYLIGFWLVTFIGKIVLKCIVDILDRFSYTGISTNLENNYQTFAGILEIFLNGGMYRKTLYYCVYIVETFSYVGRWTNQENKYQTFSRILEIWLSGGMHRKTMMWESFKVNLITNLKV